MKREELERLAREADDDLSLMCTCGDGDRLKDACHRCTREVILSALERVDREARQEALEKACAIIEAYAAAFPEDIFPPPDPPTDHGKTKDACSAQVLRISLPIVAAEMRRAFADEGEGR